MTEAATTTAAAAAAAPAVPKPEPINEFVTMELETFHFKRETLKNDKGEEIGKGKKLPSADLYLPVPRPDYLKSVLDNPDSSEFKLLMEAVNDIVYNAARAQVNEFRESNKDATVTAACLNYEKLGWKAIADTPRNQRGSSVPADEDFKDFFEAYKRVMPAVLDKSADKVENQTKLLADPRKVKDKKEVLEYLKSCVALFVTNVGEEGIADHIDVINYINNRLTKVMESKESYGMDNI